MVVEGAVPPLPAVAGVAPAAFAGPTGSTPASLQPAALAAKALPITIHALIVVVMAWSSKVAKSSGIGLVTTND